MDKEPFDAANIVLQAKSKARQTVADYPELQNRPEVEERFFYQDLLSKAQELNPDEREALFAEAKIDQELAHLVLDVAKRVEQLHSGVPEYQEAVFVYQVLQKTDGLNQEARDTALQYAGIAKELVPEILEQGGIAQQEAHQELYEELPENNLKQTLKM